MNRSRGIVGHQGKGPGDEVELVTHSTAVKCLNMNKENLSNYQLLKRKPSVCSTVPNFSKLITVVQFSFRATPVLQWFQLNFGAGNFRGRRPGTIALRMLLRLTAVNPAIYVASYVGRKSEVKKCRQKD